MLSLAANASLGLSPRTLEVAAGLLVLTCATTSAFTFGTALHRWQTNRRAGEPGPLLFAWMQLRLEALVLASQLVAVAMTVYRVFHPDIYSSVGRATIAALLAVALWTNRRDFRRL